MSKIKFQGLNKANNQKKKSNRSFYIALAVCITAVGIAAWSTYSSVMNYLNPDTPATVKPSTSIGKAVSGITDGKNDGKTQSSSDLNSTSSKLTESVAGQEADIEPADNDEKADNVDTEPLTQDNEQAIETGASVTPVDTQLLGALIYPVGKTILKDYSGENPVYSATFGDWRVHSGIDFAADKGAAVKAMAGGVVKEIYSDDLLGVTVVIEHNGGFVGYYSGLGETTLVRPGDAINAGDIIGSVKSVPSEISDEPHLHLEIKVGDTLVDPMEFLDNRD
ncbi:MAG: peptidoglycan DD-metalloendopeptidase family protein [Acutalibacteraceae bacterium]